MSAPFGSHNPDGAGQTSQKPGEDFLIVGLAASAGGIKALKEVFAHIPARSDIAYVVILHLSPDHDSNLAEILQQAAAIPVTQVKRRVRVKPNHVYVISPNKSLSMNDGYLSLTEIKRVEERRAPVDIFFRALAESKRDRAVCVVLSGTGPDGSMGLKRVKEFGGICIAQEPKEAEYGDMPRNSIATGLVDYVLPVAEIPRKIIAYKERLGNTRTLVSPERTETDDQALRDIYMQGRLRGSEERLLTLIDSVTDYSIIIQDADGRIEVWNPGAERMFGYSQAEAIGQSIEIIFTPEDRARGAHVEEMTTAREEGRAADERWHMRKDGSRFYVSGVLTLLHDGELISYAKIARDLTESKRAEVELQHAHEELEQRVLERTNDLARANEALRMENAERRQVEKARLRLLRQLVRTQEDERRRVAREIHDHLGQLSTALRLNLEALREQCEEYAELCEPIEQTQAIAARLDATVDFLAWELRPSSLDDIGLAAALANFVQEWSTHYSIPADYHSTGMDKERPSPETETSLYRIAQEALNNSYKHAQPSRVGVILERRDDHIVLIVEDDGVGFNPDDQAEAHQGLGLLGMRERAALFGGTLEIESTPNQGTTIFARVPVSFLEEGAEEG